METYSPDSTVKVTDSIPLHTLVARPLYPWTMNVGCVFVHGIRTSGTMWRSQLGYLEARRIPAVAVDLPAHGTRRSEEFTLDEAFRTIEDAVREMARSRKVLLVGHSMGGLLATAYSGGVHPGATAHPPVDGLIGASCTSFPRGRALSAYRLLARAFDALPDRGEWVSARVLDATLPRDTRQDFGAGGYAYDAQHTALASLAQLNLVRAIARLRIPTWWVNGAFDQLRLHERLFLRLHPDAELIVVPRTTHLLPVMRPRVFNAVLSLAVATLAS